MKSTTRFLEIFSSFFKNYSLASIFILLLVLIPFYFWPIMCSFK